TTQELPHGVHLVGSVPLFSAEEVFRTVSSILGHRLRRIPDGETGERKDWINWQMKFMSNNPSLEAVYPNGRDYVNRPRFKMISSDIHFDYLGYADIAIDSYAIFARLKEAGIIPANSRFQVSLPTPLAPVISFIELQDQAEVEPAYAAGLFAELDKIAAAIPHDELALQWDTAIEFALWEEVMPSFFTNTKMGILARLIQLGNRVPRGIELGYHLCYGDAGHKHFTQPKDTTNLVEVANAISTGVKRSVNWIHMPVPRERTDDAYYAPLQHLHLQPETELYLGLIHLTDGVEGARRRIAAAQQRIMVDFGVATECGFGRRPKETVQDLLRIHRVQW
ncbi:MAG TPA: hypothetical protein VII61_03770, partial [Ktedonobacteraceae bacterium]